MGMTLSQKILAKHAGKDFVSANDLIEAKLDLVLGNDVTTAMAAAIFNNAGFTEVFDPSKIAVVLDHYAPCKDINSAELCAKSRAFAKRFSMPNFFDVGEMGIEHALIPEKGLSAPGELIVGADSHTCTYGALGAFSTGIGSTDAAAAIAQGSLWFKVPSAIKVVIQGELNEHVSGKDVILHLIGQIGVDGALYKSLEFTGEGIKSLSMADRFTMANMVIECGAKNGIFPIDDITIEYLDKTVNRVYEVLSADPDAHYEQEIVIELNQLTPLVALPHLPSNTEKIDDVKGMRIDQVVIGSCTNGRIEDLRVAAEILNNRKVAHDIRCIIIPATQKIYLDAIQEGLIEIFIKAGAVVSTPTCGPCIGGHMGVLGKGERAVATTNRNFVGRMGDTTSEIILASPAVAAASAVAGVLASPYDI
ncbi:2,3-dimethylmalate dehydratase large subunit [compost metagenome]